MLWFFNPYLSACGEVAVCLSLFSKKSNTRIHFLVLVLGFLYGEGEKI